MAGNLKPVSNEQLRVAQANSDNRNIIKKVLQQFAGLIHSDDLERCGLHGLWRTLQNHDDRFGQKFTTSLTRFVRWECLRELRQQRSSRKNFLPIGESCDDYAENKSHQEEMVHVRECMQFLSKEHRRLLEEYYLEQWTMEEIGALHNMSKETVRQKLEAAIRRLRELSTEEDEPVYSDSV